MMHPTIRVLHRPSPSIQENRSVSEDYFRPCNKDSFLLVPATGLYLAIHADPMRFCKHTLSNRACLLSGHGLAVKGDPMGCPKNPDASFWAVG